MSLLPFGILQTKKKHYDTELESLEKHQKQTIEKMEGDHNVKLKEETKRIKAEQERDHRKFQDQLKNKKKEVQMMTMPVKLSTSVDFNKAQLNMEQQMRKTFTHLYSLCDLFSCEMWIL